MRWVTLVSAAGIALLSSGCGTVRSFGKLPSHKDLANKSRYELQTQYPDLAKFDPASVKIVTYGADLGEAEDLVAAWGEPDEWSASGWNLIPFIAVLRPRTYWGWHVGDKDIEARIDHHWFRLYRPEVRWIDLRVRNEVREPRS
jgi:hypothetical protein